MKKIFVLLSLIVLATSCDWFVFDNQEYYNASVEGKITDTKTGQPIQFAFPNTCKISVIEEGWTDKAGNPAEEAQSWYVKCNGVYVNKLVWAAKYRMETKDQNFYPVSIPFELKKGANTVNFEVTPYCRVLDPQITFEDNKIVARFKVEVEDIAKTKTVDVALFGFTDRWVSDGNNNFDFDKVQKEGQQKKIKNADGTSVIELSSPTSAPTISGSAPAPTETRTPASATTSPRSSRCPATSPRSRKSPTGTRTSRHPGIL